MPEQKNLPGVPFREIQSPPPLSSLSAAFRCARHNGNKRRACPEPAEGAYVFPSARYRCSPITDSLFPSCHPERSEGPMYSPPRFYYVYIMTNRSKTLYTGVTGNLE